MAASSTLNKLKSINYPAQSSSRNKMIADKFGLCADFYHDNSQLQQDIAATLLRLAPAPNQITNILELGCGSGHLSKLLLQHFPHANITLSDLSLKMLDLCRTNTGHKANQYLQLDAASLPAHPGRFDLIISSMSLQWLPSPHQCLTHWQEYLTPSGQILYSSPADHNFPQWQRVLEKLKLPNGLIEIADLPGQITKIAYTREYTDAFSFFKYLKQSGTATPSGNYHAIPAGKLKKAFSLLEKNGNPLTITWSIQFGRLLATSNCKTKTRIHVN